MARPRKVPLKVDPVPQEQMFQMIVTAACVLLGGDKVARLGDEINVTEQVRKTLLHARNARDV